VRTGRRRITKAIAAATGVVLVLVLSRHERPAFALSEHGGETDNESTSDPPAPRPPAA